ncbi:MAG: DUF2182 domain-containing protein [Gammaproteobacteria bacterium]|nr:DUF2182 domain-containing protein [Gammaproteobacteria bacterium]
MRLTGNGSGLGRERRIALAGVAAVTAAAWLYLLYDAASMSGADGMAMPAAAGLDAPMEPREPLAEGALEPPAGAPGAGFAWSPPRLAATFFMWAVMMAAMMLPSAVPAIAFYGVVVRRNAERGVVLASTWIFTAGYLAVWTAFSAAATALQAALSGAGLLTADLAAADRRLGAAILVAAGLYQWLPIKDACLAKCRSPLELFVTQWRPGASGAFRLGARHGLWCLGCCWVLMLLLFVAGVMNLLWVALIAAFVLAEKTLPGGRLIARVTGAALVAAGVLTAAGSPG